MQQPAVSWLHVLDCSEGGNPRNLVTAEKKELYFTVVVNTWSLALDGTEIPLKAAQHFQF